MGRFKEAGVQLGTPTDSVTTTQIPITIQRDPPGSRAVALTDAQRYEVRMDGNHISGITIRTRTSDGLGTATMQVPQRTVDELNAQFDSQLGITAERQAQLPPERQAQIAALRREMAVTWASWLEGDVRQTVSGVSSQATSVQHTRALPARASLQVSVPTDLRLALGAVPTLTGGTEVQVSGGPVVAATELPGNVTLLSTGTYFVDLGGGQEGGLGVGIPFHSSTVDFNIGYNLPYEGAQPDRLDRLRAMSDIIATLESLGQGVVDTATRSEIRRRLGL